MTDKEKKSKIADILMDFQEEYSNEVINRPMLASLYAGNILSFIDSLQEEPISEDLEKAADNALNNVLNTHEIVNVRSCLEMFKFGAKWQKQQDQSTIELAEDHAMLAGMEKMKEEMMANAIDAVVKFEYTNNGKTYGFVDYDFFALEDMGFKAENKVKLIIIKED